MTETVLLLGSISMFIIVDLSSPRSVPHEIATLVPHVRSANIYPIINEDEQPYGMFQELIGRDQVYEVKYYNSDNLHDKTNEIIEIEITN